MKSIFITGVDTDIGKTFVSVGLCLKYEMSGKNVAYYKPFQSGAYEKDGKLIAPDVFELKKYSNVQGFYSYLFEGEVSPNLAAETLNIQVDENKIKNDFKKIENEFDFIVTEGAGGLYCPAYKGKLFSDIIKLLNLETIIVTTPCLGRLNHTLMTLECAKLNGIKVKGIIINKVPNKMTPSEEKFLDELKMFSDVKILGIVPEIKNYSKEDIIKVFNQIDLFTT